MGQRIQTCRPCQLVLLTPVVVQVEADDREGDRLERMRQRAQLVQQLQQEQAASEALVEALKQVGRNVPEAQAAWSYNLLLGV